MKNIKLTIITLLLFTISSCIQQKRYVSYKIKEGETINSVAKRYDMSEADLLQINPGIGKTPPPNTVIIVPKKDVSTSSETKKETPKPVEKKYATYKVEKGDTLFSLSKRFGMTIDELKQENPILLQSELKEGMELLYVKNNPNREIVEANSNIDNYDTHEVIKGDTVYNLTHKYHISQEDLFALNPELSEGLKLGMVLKIRKKTAKNEETDIEITDETIEESSSLLLENLTTGKIANIAVMLPYQLNTLQNDEAVVKKLEKSNSLTHIATDFHQGITMAIDSLKSRGVEVNLTFFDTENSKRKLGKLILNNDFSTYDAIIGPLFFDNAQLLAGQVSTPVILPFYSKKQTGFASNNLIKSMPSQKNTEKKLLSYLKENYNGEKVLVVTDNKSSSKSRLWRVVNELKSFDSIKDLSVLKPKKGYIDRERFQEEIKENTKNWVILIGDDVVTTADVVNNLGILPKDTYHIKLFSFEKDNNFDNVSNRYLSRLQFTYPTSVYNDIFNPKVKRFYQKFKSENNTLPSKYALRGFDLTYDVITRIVSYNTLIEGFQQGKSSRLTSVFNYNDSQNKDVILVRYQENLQPEVIE